MLKRLNKISLRLLEGDVIPLGLLFAAVALLVFYRVQDSDFFWHVANGKAMLQQGRIINEEIFSYTRPGVGFSNHEWLAQIILYVIFNMAGPFGIVMFKTSVVVLLAFLLFKTARFNGADRLWSGLLVAFVIFEGLERYRERPEIFSFLLLGLMGFLLSGHIRGRLKTYTLYMIPCILVLWDFLHGAMYGIIFFASFVAGETIKHFYRKFSLQKQKELDIRDDSGVRTLWIVSGISIVAMLVSPYGLRSYDVFIEFLRTNPLVTRINEWTPPNFQDYHAFWFLLALVILLTLIFRKKADITHLLVLLPFTVLALKYRRATPFFGLVAIPLLAIYISSIVAKFSNAKWLKGMAYILTAVFIGYTVFIKFLAPDNPYSFGYKVNSILMPVGTTRFIAQSELQGNMVNPGHFGGYLAYYLYPKRKISFYNHHLVFANFPPLASSQNLLDEYKAEYVVADRNYDSSEFNPQIFTPDRWSLVFWDNVSLVLVRRDGINEPLVARYDLKYFTPEVLDALMHYKEKHALLDAYESDPAKAIVLTREIASCIQFYDNKLIADYLGYLVLRYQNYMYADALHYIENGLRYNDSSAYLWYADSSLRKKAGDTVRSQFSLKKALSLDPSLVAELEHERW